MSTHAHAHGTTTPDPPSPSHHLNIPNDDDDDDDEHDQHDEHDGHDDKYPHSDHHTPTQDAIIDVLAHLHPQPQSNDDASDAGYQSFSHQATVTVADQDTREGPAEGSPAVAAGSSAAARASDLASTKPISLKGWSKPQLRDEVLRLRRLLASQTQPPHGSSVQSADANIDPTLLGAPSSSIGPSSPGVFAPATEDNDGPASSAVQASGSTGAVDVDIKTESKRKRKAKEEVVRDGETGKRVERSRRTELGKALRNKVSLQYSLDKVTACGRLAPLRRAHARCASAWASPKKTPSRPPRSSRPRRRTRSPSWRDTASRTGSSPAKRTTPWSVLTTPQRKALAHRSGSTGWRTRSCRSARGVSI